MTQDMQSSAVQEFRTARFQANMEVIRSHLTGRSADLLSYDEVRKKIRARETNRRELKEIPLDAIVGSVGRYKDFTRQFLPRIEGDEQRWAKVKTLSEGLEGLPPIEVYQIGDVYFVSDGNHRVSVARSHGSTLIEAYVTQVETDVPLEADTQPDDLIIKEQYAQFLDRTRLKDSYPDLDMRMSCAGNYRVLEEQITMHQWWVKENKGEDISYREAAERWYKFIYWPVIQMIRQRGMMADFPNRTETDLFVWIHKHREELADELGWSVDTPTAVADLAETQKQRPIEVIKRIGKTITETIIPEALEAGPEAGVWRTSFLAGQGNDRLFLRILVAVNGLEEGWGALDMALQFAHLEGGRIYGLHVTKKKKGAKSKSVKAIIAEFQRRCAEASIPAEISIERGKVARTIADRARWTDLVVVSLAHPPEPFPSTRLNSQFRVLLRRCPRPVLAVPRPLPAISNLLLAYDGSPKAREALYVAAYLTGQWRLPLKVVTVYSKIASPETAAEAASYLAQHDINAEIVHQEGDPGQLILDTAAAQQNTLLIMGSYGQSPLVEAALGSVIGEVLLAYKDPILICR